MHVHSESSLVSTGKLFELTYLNQCFICDKIKEKNVTHFYSLKKRELLKKENFRILSTTT
jgi:hypothetical protein